MVIKRILIIILINSFLSFHSQSRIIEHITIDSTGTQYRSQQDGNKSGCEDFKPTKEQIIHFFKVAKEFEFFGSLEHEYYSPCIAVGSILFNDGSSGRWTIQSSGLAYFTQNNKITAVFFHKDNPWYDPFECSYGLGDEPEC